MAEREAAEREVLIGAAVGLHARPAALFTQAVAAMAPLEVRLSDESGRTVDAASMLGVLSLGIAHGARVRLTAHGDGAETALEWLAAMLERDLDAD